MAELKRGWCVFASFLVLCCVWVDVCDGLIISKLFNKLYYLFNDETTVYDCRSVTHIG